MNPERTFDYMNDWSYQKATNNSIIDELESMYIKTKRINKIKKINNKIYG